MKKLIQLTLATVFVVITVLTVNINQADAAVPLVCELQPRQECSGIARQYSTIFFVAVDEAPFQAGATVDVRGACDFTMHVPPHRVSHEICDTQYSGPYAIINDGPDSVRVSAYSE